MPLTGVPTEYHAAEASARSISTAVLRKGSVLLVADKTEVGGMLRFCLEKEGYEVLDASTLREALHLCSQSCPTAIVLNLDMPSFDSFQVLLQLRRQSRSHIMTLSSADDEVSKIRAFDSGANDYLVRPVSMAELAARLRAIQRAAPDVAPQEFRAGELTVDLSNRSVKIAGRLVKLTATEFSLLSLFVRNAGKTLTHAQILREVWGPKMVNKLQYLRVYLKSLRDKLEMNPAAP
jgi:two-component system KDP operon response regulator KdpE